MSKKPEMSFDMPQNGDFWQHLSVHFFNALYLMYFYVPCHKSNRNNCIAVIDMIPNIRWAITLLAPFTLMVRPP